MLPTVCKAAISTNFPSLGEKDIKKTHNIWYGKIQDGHAVQETEASASNVNTDPNLAFSSI